MKKALDIKNLSVSFGDKRILENISLSVNMGEVVAIIGPNGSGKTTLLKAILGLVPYTGKIILPAKRSHDKNIGYVPQRFQFDPKFPITVSELIGMSFPSPKKKEKRFIMEEVGVAYLSRRMLGVLSGGELQKVLIARSAIKKPKLWLLDEATTGIDAAHASEFFTLVEKMKNKWKSGIVIISHEMDVVHRLANRVIGLNRAIVFEGKPEKTLSPSSFRALYGEEFSLISKK
ncbi:MAG: metal ABC transporter ATP-binding protein [Parcubacteria group bacterium]